MTNHDTARWETAKRIADFNKTYVTELSAIPDYNLEADELERLLPKIEAAAAMQQQDNTGKAVNKGDLRSAMAATLVMYSKRAMVKAQRLGNTTLEEGLDHPESYYQRSTVAQSLARAIAPKDLLKANLAVLNNLSAADMTAIEKAIADFEAVTDAPQTARQTKKVHGTDQIDPLLDRTETLIDNMANLIDSYLSNTPRAAEFELKSRLIELGVRSNSVTLTVQDAATDNPYPVPPPPTKAAPKRPLALPAVF